MKGNFVASKQETIEKFRYHEKDTGSSEVQIALLTDRINGLLTHFKENKKDHHSRRGLLLLVGQRARLLRYLKNTDMEKFKKITKELNI